MAQSSEKVLSPNTIKSYELSFGQYAKFLEQEKLGKPTKANLEKFIHASAKGFPNGKPKKPSAIGIKYKGICYMLNQQGVEIEWERNFVNKTLGLAIEEKAPKVKKDAAPVEAPVVEETQEAAPKKKVSRKK